MIMKAMVEALQYEHIFGGLLLTSGDTGAGAAAPRAGQRARPRALAAAGTSRLAPGSRSVLGPTVKAAHPAVVRTSAKF